MFSIPGRVALGAVCVISLILGLLTVIWPAPSIEGVFGLHITYGYGILIIIGSIGVLWGLIRPNYRIELNFIWVLMCGYVVYDIGLWTLFAERVGVIDGMPPPYGPALAVAVLCAVLLSKGVNLYKAGSQLIKASDEHGVD